MAKSFTLVELLVVAGLLALVASVAIPTFQLLLSQAQLSAATTQVADMLRLQEQQTVTQQKIYGVTSIAGATSIPNFLCLNGGCTSKTIQYLALPNNIQISGETFAGNDVDFSTAGAPNYSGTLTLEDMSRLRRRDIQIKPSGAILDSTPEY